MPSGRVLRDHLFDFLDLGLPLSLSKGRKRWAGAVEAYSHLLQLAPRCYWLRDRLHLDA